MLKLNCNRMWDGSASLVDPRFLMLYSLAILSDKDKWNRPAFAMILQSIGWIKPVSVVFVMADYGGYEGGYNRSGGPRGGGGNV